MTDALAALAALGHAKRLGIFRRLVAAGPDGRVAGDLAADLKLPAPTLSFHLKELTHARLIDAEPRGRFVCYRANFTAMNALIAYLTENCCSDSPLAGCAPGSCAPPASTARTRRVARAR
jgi:ArsR family transcriptional regulator